MNSSFSSVSVIIPVRNEADNIITCLTRTRAALPDAELLVIDGGSDRTESLVNGAIKRDTNIRYISNHPDRGKGHAIKTGIAAARGNVLVQLDGDLQFLPEELPRLIGPILRNEADMTLGTRFSKGSRREPGSTPLLRSFGNRVISTYTSVLLRQNFTDVLAGVKAWRREMTEQFDLKSDNYSYEAELVTRGVLNKWRVVEISVSTEARAAGQSSVRVFRVGLQLLRDITHFRLQGRTQ